MSTAFWKTETIAEQARAQAGPTPTPSATPVASQLPAETPAPAATIDDPKIVSAALVDAAPDLAAQQAGALEHPHVFRGAGKAHAEGCRQFPDRAFPFRQMAKHGPPRWIRKGVKNRIEMCRMFNHVVQYR